ncbi:DUF7266 family protein [Halopenitus persicus]|uniref:DUF7266 family protein n=1 Tax=Halopenitus persicus TaxID=1048396 RepID=UPI001E364CE8|nr:hypothetical protein [Halopenitus persicus]
MGRKPPLRTHGTPTRSRTASTTRSRAVTPVAGKLLEIGIVVLFVATLSTALYGGVVPDYRSAVAEEVGDRTLTAAGHAITSAVPPDPRSSAVRSATTRRAVDLPETIRGESYRIRFADGALTLEHPDPAVGGRRRLAFPTEPAGTASTWRSDARTLVVVRRVETGLTVELVNR